MTTTKHPVVISVAALASVVVLGAASAACSSSAADVPLTRAAGADSVSNPSSGTVDGAGGRTVTLGPLDQRVTPDVLVRLAAPFDGDAQRQLTGLVPAGRAVMLRTASLPVAAPTGAGTVSAVGVDPAVFRRITPQNTAEVTGVWDNVAKGYAALSYSAAKRLGVALGGRVTVAGAPLEVGALADTGLPDIDVVVSNDVANRLSFPAPNAIVLSGGKDDPTPLALGVRKAVAKTARVDLLRSPAQHMTFFNGTDAKRRLGTLTYQVQPDGKVVVDPKWVADFIVTQQVPILGRMTCHRALFPQLTKALDEVAAAGLADKIHPDQYEGCYWPKLIEDSDHLSMHAWGLAFDINTVTNQRLSHGDMDPGVVAIFKKWGFRWGGDWKDTPDPMHFELAALLNV
jgi:hypothetical protein